ncbi:hypothetical protein ACJIZ3_024421 [Penstemon smallii]|uniref:BSD2 cysteine rich domain-containing protein n=1 Tax=Penstemon smallii TaxID=265156 RepID=A0ABD3TU84_9LAMI
MANSVCFSPLISVNTIDNHVIHVIDRTSTSDKNIIRKPNWMSTKNAAFQALKVKATGNSSPRTKPNSIICTDCDGAGCKECSQCEGKGVNIVDHFNGQFKAGAVCWLCSGKKKMLCGNCNGAGFVGGFMSTYDE